MAKEVFYWQCPFMTCESKFDAAASRLTHLEDNHWVKTPARIMAHTNDEFIQAMNELRLQMAKIDKAIRPTPPPLRRPKQQLSLYDDGDYTVVLGNEEEGQVEVSVSSQALSMCSPVWKKMVTGNFREAIEKKMSLPDDDGDSILLILAIAHMQFLRIPTYSTARSEAWLHSLAVVCHKYNCEMVVTPWVRQWMGRGRNLAMSKASQILTAMEWLDISWTFGDVELFQKMARLLMEEGVHSKTPNVLLFHSEPVELQAAPPSAIGT
ncbi:hypothetical protein BT63DRAFT_111948 [Microthyrium microscopicum]|uniref:C2H2-type domain-containing protein n=1 Tax=Microthyrium microscopicum TaxID=703497 RepID=A0A6A6TUM7_9PEZI|nr:hypothetical protein BT63DRAFT_111948 [Microthyrium microscopicum]